MRDLTRGIPPQQLRAYMLSVAQLSSKAQDL
jgi:hypothetical protein